MKQTHFLLSSSAIALAIFSAASASAANIEMSVAQAIDASDRAIRCPAKLIITQGSRPYREGGYTLDGSAKLNAVAEGFTIATSDDFSVTWVAKLKAPYSKCKATARMAKVGGEAYQGHSYLRMRFANGKAYLILDMAGMSDANNFTPTILKKTVQNGNPAWSWGGTD
ncbi:MAG: hypothetical protein HC936_08130 [Leptolyngbyaceae cyanobacterium SU_3_3]|nr:hypothetical protein [Leptolyngbyaceae cyanobacterium SU_3_3]NJR49898.1 hypothetical protein [Leptolyngbyaceae cyanobacterium CSU_1_3]